MKKNTIRRTLFSTYVIIISVAFISASALLFVIELSRQREQVFTSLMQNTRSIAASMDSELDQMHSLVLARLSQLA